MVSHAPVPLGDDSHEFQHEKDDARNHPLHAGDKKTNGGHKKADEITEIKITRSDIAVGHDSTSNELSSAVDGGDVLHGDVNKSETSDSNIRINVKRSEVRDLIYVISTGGTIVSRSKIIPGHPMPVAMPGYTGKDFYKRFISKTEVSKKYRFEWDIPDGFPEQGVDSNNLKEWQIEDLGRKIVEISKKAKPKGVIVLHGTDSMANTGQQLPFMLSNLPFPVVLTGAQHEPDASISDAQRNFGLACRVAISDIAEVVLAMGNHVMRANAIVKKEGVVDNPFDSPHQDPLAELRREDLIWNEQAHPRRRSHVTDEEADEGIIFSPRFSGVTRIILMRQYLNDLKRMENELQGVDAAIISGYAAGNVAPDLKDLLEYYAERMHIIITPTSATRGVREAIYVGSPLVSHPQLIFAQQMLPETAEYKYRWIRNYAEELGIHGMHKHEWIRSRFMENYAFEGQFDKSKIKSPLDLHKFLKSKTVFPTQNSLKAEKELRYGMRISRITQRWLRKHARELFKSRKERETWVRDRQRVPVPLKYIDPDKTMNEEMSATIPYFFDEKQIESLVHSRELIGGGDLIERVEQIHLGHLTDVLRAEGLFGTKDDADIGDNTAESFAKNFSQEIPVSPGEENQLQSDESQSQIMPEDGLRDEHSQISPDQEGDQFPQV